MPWSVPDPDWLEWAADDVVARLDGATVTVDRSDPSRVRLGFALPARGAEGLVAVDIACWCPEGAPDRPLLARCTLRVRGSAVGELVTLGVMRTLTEAVLGLHDLDAERLEGCPLSQDPNPLRELLEAAADGAPLPAWVEQDPDLEGTIRRLWLECTDPVWMFLTAQDGCAPATGRSALRACTEYALNEAGWASPGAAEAWDAPDGPAADALVAAVDEGDADPLQRMVAYAWALNDEEVEPWWWGPDLVGAAVEAVARARVVHARRAWAPGAGPPPRFDAARREAMAELAEVVRMYVGVPTGDVTLGP
ncbi:MAG: hypothetical protein R3F59_09960 [Myxococcota bacterium]